MQAVWSGTPFKSVPNLGKVSCSEDWPDGQVVAAGRGVPVEAPLPPGVVAQGLGHAVLLLEQQAVGALARPPLELDADLEDDAVGGVEGGVVAGEEDAAGQLGPVQGVDVAQAAAALLEIRLQKEGDLAGRLVTLGHRVPEGGEPP